MDTYQSLFDGFSQGFLDKNLEKKGDEWRTSINPDDIFNSPDADNSDKFWAQHGENNDRYKELIINYQKAQEEVKQRGNLDHLPWDNPVSMAYQAFHGSEPISLTDYDGKLMINNNGRHRIEAAKQLKAQGYDVKLTALVTKYESKNQPPKPIEKSNIIHSSHKSSSMAHQIERQIDLLKDAKHLFLEHAGKVQDLTNDFNARVRSLEQDELNHDYMDFLEDFLGAYITHLNTIRETIEEDYVPALSKKIHYLEDRV